MMGLDTNAMIMNSIAASLSQLALLAEMKELKERANHLSKNIDDGLIIKEEDTKQAACTLMFIQARLEEIEELLWGNTPQNIGLALLADKVKEESNDSEGTEESP